MTAQESRFAPVEWHLVALVTVGVLVVTSLPYVYGALSSPPDRVFMGLVLNVPDHALYFAWWRGFQRSLVIPNRLTPEPNDPAFFNLLWWGLGQLSRWTGLGHAAVYQIFRWIAGASFLFAVYWLLGQLVERVDVRRLAFLLIAFSSGLGWVLVLLKYTVTDGELLFPLDVYIAEGNSFLCILGYPHFAFAAAFIAAALGLFWRSWTAQRLKYAWLAGGVTLLLGWMHAYDLLLIYGVMGAVVVAMTVRLRRIPWRMVGSAALIGVLSCSGAFYSVALTTFDPLWEEVLAQFANAGVYTPSPPHLFILFGWPLVGAIVAWVGLARLRALGEGTLFAMAWFVIGGVLNYIPADFQVHMLNGWQIPMMMLVALGVYEFVLPFVEKRWRGTFDRQRMMSWAIAVLVLSTLPTNLYLWAWRFVDLGRHDYPYYLHEDDVAALDWLSENAGPDDVVLASLTLGQYVPGLGGNTAFLAHWAQTVDFFDKRERVTGFFDEGGADEGRLDTLLSFGVDYVLHGPAERRLGGYDPSTATWLAPVFSKSETVVYRVDLTQVGLEQTGGEE